jgi:hypothetical protein
MLQKKITLGWFHLDSVLGESQDTFAPFSLMSQEKCLCCSSECTLFIREQSFLSLNLYLQCTAAYHLSVFPMMVDKVIVFCP